MIAYNSKVLPFIFLFCAILTSIVGYFAVRELYKYKISLIKFSSSPCPKTFYKHYKTLKKIRQFIKKKVSTQTFS